MTPWLQPIQASLPMGFPWQEYWGLPFPISPPFASQYKLLFVLSLWKKNQYPSSRKDYHLGCMILLKTPQAQSTQRTRDNSELISHDSGSQTGLASRPWWQAGLGDRAPGCWPFLLNGLLYQPPAPLPPSSRRVPHGRQQGAAAQAHGEGNERRKDRRAFREAREGDLA